MGSSSCRRVLAGLLLLALPLTTDPGRAGPPKGKDDKPRFTNRLAKETSPYLLMHAHNPVDWYPWGPEAFAKAKKEGKLIFLSIGYSSCYWCHVMERESFANEAVAKLMNQWFVSIKVDREERPDVDHIYMTALTLQQQGRGGWPLSMFLTAEGKPVVGGTYWPREDKEIDGEKQRGFKTILKLMQKFWAEDVKGILKQAESLAAATRSELESPAPGVALVALDRKLAESAVEPLTEGFDPVYGGFGSPARKFRGPKFPTPPRLEYLLQLGERQKSKALLEMVTRTLDQMALGGIYDHLGGGFHRYSTERTWTVPHFEKMLYDNAQLAEVYARAYRLTKKPLYRRVLDETLAYVVREMMTREGGFYSSQDAETHHEEGRFYVWTGKELDDALPDRKENQLLRKVYGADGKPNFEEKYHILRLAKPLSEIAKDLKRTPKELEAQLAPLRQRLFAVRAQRDHPFLNKIMLTAWSGEMIGGFARAGQALGEKKYLDVAVRAAEFVLKHQRTPEGRLLRRYGAQPGKTPKAQGHGYLEDYAYLAHGLLNLHDATGDKRWLEEARSLTDTMLKYHGDKKAGGYYFTAHDHEKLFARNKDQYDGAQPSGNSVALRNLARLWAATGEAGYGAEAEKGFKSFAGSLKVSPGSLTAMLQALDIYLDAKEAQPRKGVAERQKRAWEDIVTATAKGDEPDGKGQQLIRVTFKIADKFWVYANPVGPPELAGIETQLALSVEGKPQKASIVYPEGELVKDRDVGDYRIYKGQVILQATVQRERGDRRPLKATVRCLPANGIVCQRPVTLHVPVR